MNRVLIITCIAFFALTGHGQETLSIEAAISRAVDFYNQGEAAVSDSAELARQLKSQAAEILVAVVAAAPTYAAPAFLLGMVRQREGDPRGAADAFGRCFSLEPTHADAANNLGKALSDQGDGETQIRPRFCALPDFRCLALLQKRPRRSGTGRRCLSPRTTGERGSTWPSTTPRHGTMRPRCSTSTP